MQDYKLFQYIANHLSSIRFFIKAMNKDQKYKASYHIKIFWYMLFKNYLFIEISMLSNSSKILFWRIWIWKVLSTPKLEIST